MKPEFVEMVVRASKAAGNQRKLGEALGLSEKTISRVVNGAGYSFNFENCVALARLLGAEPEDVLRAADKDDLAALVEEIRGGRSTIPFAERTLLKNYRDCPPDLQRDFSALIATAAKRERERRVRAPRRRRP